MHTLGGLRVIHSFRTGLKQHPNICHSSLLLRLSARTFSLQRQSLQTQARDSSGVLVKV